MPVPLEEFDEFLLDQRSPTMIARVSAFSRFLLQSLVLKSADKQRLRFWGGKTVRYGSMYQQMLDPIEGLARAALERMASARAVVDPSSAWHTRDVQVSTLCEHLIEGDLHKAEALVQNLSAGADSFEEIAEGHIAEASRRLGKLWDLDKISFAEVSIGVSTLFFLATRMKIESALTSKGLRGNAFFVAMEGQAHTLGIVLASEAFIQHGWSVDLRLVEECERALKAIAANKPMILGMTCSQADRWEDTAYFIAKAKSLGPTTHVILGGNLVTEQPEIANQLGADCLVSTLTGALAEADRVWVTHHAERRKLH